MIFLCLPKGKVTCSEFGWPGCERQEPRKELKKGERRCVLALRTRRHGAGRDEVVERQTLWLRAGHCRE